MCKSVYLSSWQHGEELRTSLHALTKATLEKIFLISNSGKNLLSIWVIVRPALQRILVPTHASSPGRRKSTPTTSSSYFPSCCFCVHDNTLAQQTTPAASLPLLLRKFTRSKSPVHEHCTAHIRRRGGGGNSFCHRQPGGIRIVVCPVRTWGYPAVSQCIFVSLRLLTRTNFVQ